MHRLLARLVADRLAALPASAAEADDGPVSCPFGRHAMERLGPAVWTCENDGVTLIARASGRPQREFALDAAFRRGNCRATSRSPLEREKTMSLLFFGKDPDSDDEHCPSAWVDEATADLVLQGWKSDDATQAECLNFGSLPDTEAVIRIPARMVPQLRKACDAAERAAGTSDIR